MTGINEERAHHPRGAGREERLERPRGRAEIGLAFLLDEDIAEGEEAVTGQIKVAQTITFEKRGALRADVLGDRYGIGPLHLGAELA